MNSHARQQGPTTVAQGFQVLKQNLEITGLQQSTASTRQQEVRNAVEAKMKVLDSFLTGSYRRNTMIAPLREADIDIFIVLDPCYFSQSGQTSLLDQTRKVLLQRYPKSPRISRNGQAVTITFADFKVDVVPGFNRTGGGYLIPDSHQRIWIPTDPKKHVDIWSTHNARHNGDLVPVLKMLKGWNKANGETFESFHLETLALHVLSKVRITDFPSAVRYVFDKARTFVLQPLNDPADYGGMLQARDSNTAFLRLEAAHSLALAAERLNLSGLTREAFANWRRVFGSYFPAHT